MVEPALNRHWNSRLAWSAVLLCAASSCSSEHRAGQPTVPDAPPAAGAGAPAQAGGPIAGQQDGDAGAAPDAGPGRTTDDDAGAGAQAVGGDPRRRSVLCNAAWQAPGLQMDPELRIARGAHPPETVPVISADAAGRVVVAFNFQEADLGAGTESSDTNRIALLSLDADCQTRWSKRLVGSPPPGRDAETQQLYVVSTATDSASNIVLAGYLKGVADFGGGPRSANERQVFVAKFDAAGEHLWSMLMGTGSVESRVEVRVAAGDRLVLSGVDIEQRDTGYVALLDPAGATLWSARDVASRRPGAAPSPDGSVVAKDRDPDNDLEQDFAFGLGGRRIAKFDASGSRVWTIDMHDLFGFEVRVPFDRDRWLAVDAHDDVYHLSADVTPGGYEDDFPALYSATLLGPERGWLAKLGPDGAAQWSLAIGDGVGTRPGALAIRNAGGALVGGDFLGDVQFGPTQLHSQGPRDVFVLGVDERGEPTSLAQIGTDGGDFISALANDRDDNTWVAGWIGTAEFDGSNFLYDRFFRSQVFVAKLAP